MTLLHPSPLVLPGTESFSSDGVARVETTTLLPGGAIATLTLRQTGEHFSVDDEGGGRAAIAALGFQNLTRADARRGSEIARKLGLVFVDDNFILKDVSFGQLSSAIVYVAEASRAWAAATVEAHQKIRHRDLVGRAVERLRTSLPTMDVQIERELPGASNKLHRFDMIVSLPRERFAVFETLLPASSSIAAAHLKFYDIKQAHPEWPREAMVEDFSEWASEDLAMLQQVSSGVREINTPWDDLKRLAA